MTYFRYNAFGLTIRSDIELPMLLPAKKYAKVQLKIYKDEINESGLVEAKVKQLHFQACAEQLWLRVPKVGLFLVTEGNRITYWPDSQVDDKTLQLFILGTCMGALLQQREVIVLHAMAVKFGEHVAVFAGSSGVGKTTLAAMMHKQGYEILSDDLCVIDQEGLVQSGYPVLKVWQDCLKVLEIQAAEIQPLRKGLAKYAYRLDKGFCKGALPIKSMYLLHTWNKDEPEIKTIPGIKKLMPIRAQTYRAQYLEGMGLTNANMLRLMKLAGKIRLCSVTRPQNNFKVASLIELIETDFEQAQNTTNEQEK